MLEAVVRRSGLGFLLPLRRSFGLTLRFQFLLLLFMLRSICSITLCTKPHAKCVHLQAVDLVSTVKFQVLM